MVFTGFFDTLMVGKLGYESLAAAGICNGVFFFISVFPIGVSMAYATIVGILQGKGKTSSYRLLARDSFMTTIGLSIVASAVIYGFVTNFSILGQTAEVQALAVPYMTLLMWSLLPMMVFFFAKNLCDGFSFTIGGMVITLVALALNVFLNWVFIYGNLGSEAYGLNGAGYATILSRIFLAVSMLLVFFYSKRIPISWNQFIASFRESRRISFYKRIFAIGFPSGLQYFFEVAAFAGAAVMAGWLGAQELAAHNLAITLASVTYMFAGGISAGSSICVAKAYGNKNKENVKAYGYNGLKLGFVVTIVFALGFYLFNQPLAALFTSEPAVLKMGAELLIIAAIFQLSDGIQAVGVGILRGIEDVSMPSALIFIAYWIIAMPIGYYLSHYSSPDAVYHGVNGIWIGLCIGLTISAAFLSYRFYHLLRSK
jgi:MATE family multidrug resistance protein|tara:strand:- start:10954 stop:12234 length:1281 start_codon:yes stop_codon:yes gene_type:complete